MEVEPNRWTMPVEVAVQLNQKRVEGQASNYSIGYKLFGQPDILLDTANFMTALAWLKENEYVR